MAVIALAGCVSSADMLAEAGKSVDKSTVASSASGSGAASGTAKDAETASAGKPVEALALAEQPGSTPALEAADTVIADTGEKVEVPAISPRDTAGAAAAAAAEDQGARPAGKTLQTSGTVAMTAKDAAPDPIQTSSIRTNAADHEPASPLARLFSRNQAGRAAPGRSPLSPRSSGSDGSMAPQATDDEASDEPDEPAGKAPVETASASTNDGNALPGVRLHSIYEFDSSSRSGDMARSGGIELASAAGAARLAPGFLVKQRDTVQTACLKPALLGILKMVERHFGRPVVITSGYRGPVHNAAVGGVRHSEHMKCAAADIQLDNVSKWEVARYVRSLPGSGGVGTYCHTDSVHVDIGERRDWNWRCRRRH